MSATKKSLYDEAIRLFGDARLDTILDDVESRRALDDAWPSTVDFCLRAAAWRFAMKTWPLVVDAGPLPGFAIAYSRPADWLRTHALFLVVGELEHPIDIREQGVKFSSNTAAAQIRWVSSDYSDPELVGNPWPEHFSKAVAAHLAFSVADRLTNSASAGVRMSQLYGSLVAEAIVHDALPEDPWLRYQLDGSFQEMLHYVLKQGYWRFALKTVRQTDLAPATPAYNYGAGYAQPADWLRTHALFVPIAGVNLDHPFDAREHDRQWSTDAAGFAVRYVSAGLGLDPVKWPQPFLTTVLAYLTPPPTPTAEQRRQGGEAQSSPLDRILGETLASQAEPEDPWLRHQLDGSFNEALRFVLKQGYWRFALRTQSIAAPDVVPPAVGYAFAYAQPADNLRTQALFISVPGTGLEHPFDIREHDTHWSTDATNFAVRYVSGTLGTDPLHWPQPFLEAVYAYLTPAPPPRQQGTADPDITSFQGALAAALIGFSEPEDPWLRHQLDGTFIEGARFVLKQGCWRFALKTADLATPDATPAFDYAYGFNQPGDWLYTHALFIAVPGTGLAHPFDVKEHDRQWSTNTPNFAARYVSAELGLDPLKWPQTFLEAVLSYLTPAPAPIQQGRRSAQGAEASPFTVTLAEALAVSAEPDDPWLRHQLDGAFLQALRYVLKQGAWRFALKTTAQADLSPVSPAAGYSTAWAQPGDWLRTHALFLPIPSTGLEHPFDVREHDRQWSTDYPNFAARYVSAHLGLDPFKWPQPFLAAVQAYLSPAPPAAEQGGRPEISPFLGILANALASFAEPEDPWLAFQLDGTFVEGLRFVLRQGYWSFALRTEEFTATAITETPSTTPQIGYPYGYLQPPDMLRSHAYFIPAGDGREYPFDIKENFNHFSTTAPYFAVRFVSSRRGLDPYNWPQPFLDVVLSYLHLREAPEVPSQTSRSGQAISSAAASYENLLQKALAVEGEPENPWYRFQRSGAFLRAVFHVAETGRWKFAIATLNLEADATLNDGNWIDGTLPANVYGDGSISPSYAAVTAKPVDWLRTINMYRVEHHGMPHVDGHIWPERIPIDFRDEGGNWHTNWRFIQVRYLKRAVIESWRWPQSYADAVLAWLEYEEARTDPKATSIAAAKQRIYEDMVDKAAKSDDSQEFPPYRTVGRLVRGRFSRVHGRGANDFMGF